MKLYSNPGQLYSQSCQLRSIEYTGIEQIKLRGKNPQDNSGSQLSTTYKMLKEEDSSFKGITHFDFE